MHLAREQAEQLLFEWTKGSSLRLHARAVEISMREAALRFGAGAMDQERFGLAGLLHDADYEAWPEEHPRRIVAWLEARGEAELAYAISAHFTAWGRPATSALDRSLVACDELSGFIVACARVRPDGLAGLEPSSVEKRLKQKSFAAKVDRLEIAAGARLVGTEVGALAGILIGALRPHAQELGCAGRGPV